MLFHQRYLTEVSKQSTQHSVSGQSFEAYTETDVGGLAFGSASGQSIITRYVMDSQAESSATTTKRLSSVRS